MSAKLATLRIIPHSLQGGLAKDNVIFHIGPTREDLAVFRLAWVGCKTNSWASFNKQPLGAFGL